MSQEQVVSVRLRRGATSTPWGFRMQGGHEYGSPLYIQQVNPKSLSMRQGLRVGDRLLAIGPVQAHNMSHEQAKMEIIRAGNELDIIVQRNASAVIDQPDSRPVQRTVDAYEEPTEYRGYTNPNVQSRSFKILQESLSYSEADEEGIVLPTGSTPGEGIVRKAYSEGRRRLEELSEINPRNFTEGGQSPYRYSEHYLIKDESNISPDVPDASSESRQRQIPDSSIAASRVYDGKVAGGSPQARSQVDLANSSVLSPAAGQQHYLQQAKRHYQQYYEDDQPTPQPVPAVHFQPVVHNVQQARPVVVQDQRSEGRPLKLVNYHFEEQYGHMYQDPQPGGRQKAVVSPQKSTDFIPATQTVSSVAADLDLKIVSPDTETNFNQIGVGKVIQQQHAQVVVGQPQKTETRRVRQRTRGHTTQTTSNVVVTSVTQQAQVPATTQIDTTDGCLMSKTALAAQSPVVQVPSAQPVAQATVQQIRVTQDAAQQGPVIQVAAEPTPAPQTVAQPTPVLQVVEQPVPVVQEVTQPTPVSQVVVQPVPVVQEVKQPTPVLQVVEQPVPVVQEVTQPTPVSQVVVQPAAIEKEPEQAQEISETTPTQEPVPVSQVVAQSTPVPEEVAKPVPVLEEVKQPAPVAQEITQSTPVQEEPEPVSSSAQEITEEASTQESQQPKEDTTTQEQVAETQKETVEIETSVDANVTVAQEISVVEQSVPDTPVPEEQTVTENVEITATTTDESQAVTIEAVEAPNTQASEVVVIEQIEIPAEESSAQSVTLSVDNAVAETAISVQSEGGNVEETIVVEEYTNVAADTSADVVEETVSFAISTTDEEASESVSLALDTSANSEETITLSDNSAAFEITSDAEVSLNISSDVTITAEGSDVGNEESEATTIILSTENVTETVENSADAEVSLSISSDVTISTDEPTNAESEVATITIAQDAEEVSPSEEGANITIALEETKSSGSESESKPKKDKPMGQKLLEQKQNDQKNSKPAKVKIIDSQGGVAARLARFKQK